MSIYRYNFNGVKTQDYKKYLQSKLDFEKWEESIAEDATIANYRYNRKISYGFPVSKNHFIIAKKMLKKIAKEYELQYIFFEKSDVEKLKNIDFIEPTSIYYLRNGEGKRELFNYNLININSINKLINDKYKDAEDDTQFILEKSTKNLLFFQGNSFELRTFILVVQLDNKIYTFLYPLLIAHFGVDNINMGEFLDFLEIGFENNSNINSYNPFLEKIYRLVNKTANTIANICKLSNYIYKLEHEKKYKNSKKSKMQYHLYAVDIIVNEDKEPFLIDIISNPIYNIQKEESKTIRQKNKMFNDLLDNFILHFARFNNINYDNSKFLLFKESIQLFEYKMIISKKISDEPTDNNDFLSKDAEKFLLKCLNDSMNDFKTDNESFIISKETSIANIILETKPEKKCLFEENKEVIVEKKIEELITKENKDKLIGIASATLPIFLATYIAKKTYQTVTKKN
jgi:hypothetical protein